jgi:hypothetical protein
LTTESSHRALRHSYVRNMQSAHAKLVFRFSRKNPVKSFLTVFRFFSLNSYLFSYWCAAIFAAREIKQMQSVEILRKHPSIIGAFSFSDVDSYFY